MSQYKYIYLNCFVNVIKVQIKSKFLKEIKMKYFYQSTFNRYIRYIEWQTKIKCWIYTQRKVIWNVVLSNGKSPQIPKWKYASSVHTHKKWSSHMFSMYITFYSCFLFIIVIPFIIIIIIIFGNMLCVSFSFIYFILKKYTTFFVCFLFYICCFLAFQLKTITFIRSFVSQFATEFLHQQNIIAMINNHRI